MCLHSVLYIQKHCHMSLLFLTVWLILSVDIFTAWSDTTWKLLSRSLQKEENMSIECYIMLQIVYNIPYFIICGMKNYFIHMLATYVYNWIGWNINDLTILLLLYKVMYLIYCSILLHYVDLTLCSTSCRLCATSVTIHLSSSLYCISLHTSA
jgi:hypothetical protein